MTNPASEEPVAWLHELYDAKGDEGSVVRELSMTTRHGFGHSGRDYDPQYAVRSTPLYRHPTNTIRDKAIDEVLAEVERYIEAARQGVLGSRGVEGRTIAASGAAMARDISQAIKALKGGEEK